MNRKTLITIHMYLSSFFAPFVLLVCISGGLYLAGIKGSVEKESIMKVTQAPLDTQSPELRARVGVLLREAGVMDIDFEYVKVKGDTLYTRPTTREHYIIEQGGGSLEVFHAVPSLQNRMIELHKGHGPTVFKSFQKVFALGLLFIIVSGLLLGITAARLRRSTLLTAATGCLLFLVLLA